MVEVEAVYKLKFLQFLQFFMPEHVLKMSDFAQKVNEIKVFKNRYLLGIDKPV